MQFIIIGLMLVLIPAVIARDKGREFIVWWIYGSFLLPVALIHLAFIPKKVSTTKT